MGIALHREQLQFATAQLYGAVTASSTTSFFWDQVLVLEKRSSSATINAFATVGIPQGYFVPRCQEVGTLQCSARQMTMPISSFEIGTIPHHKASHVSHGQPQLSEAMAEALDVARFRRQELEIERTKRKLVPDVLGEATRGSCGRVAAKGHAERGQANG